MAGILDMFLNGGGIPPGLLDSLTKEPELPKPEIPRIPLKSAGNNVSGTPMGAMFDTIEKLAPGVTQPQGKGALKPETPKKEGINPALLVLAASMLGGRGEEQAPIPAAPAGPSIQSSFSPLTVNPFDQVRRRIQTPRGLI